MLEQFTTWFLEVLRNVMEKSKDLFIDIITKALDLLLDAFVAVVGAIPVPSFMHDGLQSLWVQLDPGIVYLATKAGLPAALALLAAGYTFRLIRKFVTLFQW